MASSASLPFLAVATISKSGSSESTFTSPSRTIGWSSARTNRTDMVTRRAKAGSGGREFARQPTRRRLIGRQADIDLRPGELGGEDELATKRRNSFAQ